MRSLGQALLQCDGGPYKKRKRHRLSEGRGFEDAGRRRHPPAKERGLGRNQLGLNLPPELRGDQSLLFPPPSVYSLVTAARAD